MDPVINSLVQSPLVRSMSTVPSKASSFVHGVRDNVPPFSFQKVVVKPWNNPSKTSQDDTHKFRIPQFGTLNRAYLRIKTKNYTRTGGFSTDAASYPDVLHDTDADAANQGNFLAVPADSAYNALRGTCRLPWIHPSQSGKSVSKGFPLGQGGSHVIHAGALTNPNNGGLQGYANNKEFAAQATILGSDAHIPKSSNAWNVINVLDEMRLTTNGKLIETVYGETIPAEVVKMPEGLRDFYTRGMVGWAAGNATSGFKGESEMGYQNPWDPTACHRDGYGRLSMDALLTNTGQRVLGVHQHAYFTVPVTLSSLKTLSKNYQTRFVEDLELEVKMKELGRGFNDDLMSSTDKIKYHDVELVLIYHNWHDNIENTIRNSNYKRGVPASVYSTNWVRAATTAKANGNDGKVTIPITSRNLATEILIVAKSKAASGTIFPVEVLRRNKSDYVVSLTGDFGYTMEFTGSGKTIWSARSQELQGPDSADYDLTERSLKGGDCAYGGISRQGYVQKFPQLIAGSKVNKVGLVTQTSAAMVTQTSVDYSFGDNMALMRFGFQTTDEFYSGGIALQTISNPTITLTPDGRQANEGGWGDSEVEFDVYVKHANLVRIDSDTGAISRTLDV